MRTFVYCTLGFGAACANGDGQLDSELAESASAEDAGAALDASDAAVSTDAGSESSPVTRQLYHRAGTADAINLELKSDGTFRWRIRGCDFGGGDAGRWVSEDGATVLLPHSGRESFNWPSGGVVGSHAKVVLRSDGAGLKADLGSEQWSPGGRCARCATSNPIPGTDGGAFQLGPDTYACEQPLVYSGATWVSIPA